MVNWYSCNFSSHRANWPSGSLNDCSQVKDPWSVLRLNCLPKRYGRKCWVKVTTASSSWRVTQYLRLALLRVWLAYAITCSFPVSSSWDRTPPNPVLLASVSKINGLLNFGNARMGAKQSLWPSVWNVSWHSVFYSNRVVFSIRRWSSVWKKPNWLASVLVLPPSVFQTLDAGNGGAPGMICPWQSHHPRMY